MNQKIIHFENSQWVVTDAGIESKGHSEYSFSADRLTEELFSCNNFPDYLFDGGVLGSNTLSGNFFLDGGVHSERSVSRDQKFYSWPVHMAEKTWVKIEEFIEAFVKALEIHEGQYTPPVDETMLKRSLELARRVARWSHQR